MAGKTVSFNTHCNLYESQLESIARWLSCNGEVWGIGPTAVFASAAALFLYNELQATVFIAGDHAQVSLLEKTLVSSMVLGMLALMIHLWVCSMRFFQYYLDTLIKDSPSMLLEMTTAGLLGQTEMVPLGPLTRFLKQQQPQIHITVCWFLSLCYADYVRKHYCQRFNMPYLEQWQSELHARAARGVNSTMEKVNSFVGAVHQRLRGFSAAPLTSDAHTGIHSDSPKLDIMLLASRPEGPSIREANSHQEFGESESASERLSVGTGASARARLLGLSSDTTVDAIAKLRTYIAMFSRAKCGDGGLSAIPTFLWTAGASALAHCLVSALFRRFMFRRVPLWEIILQYLLFLWMVIYSIHFWLITVNFLKFAIEYCYEPEEGVLSAEEMEGRYFMQQWAVWLWSVVPAALFAHARADRTTPPLMIWITRSPWQRREMGAYGYYLNRPISSLQTPSESARLRALTLRKAFSDSRTIIKEPTRKRRNSKSI